MAKHNITIDDLIKEVQTELTIKRKVFPTWIRTGRIKKSVADYRIQVTEQLLKFLERYKYEQIQRQKKLFE